MSCKNSFTIQLSELNTLSLHVSVSVLQMFRTHCTCSVIRNAFHLHVKINCYLEIVYKYILLQPREHISKTATKTTAIWLNTMDELVANGKRQLQFLEIGSNLSIALPRKITVKRAWQRFYLPSEYRLTESKRHQQKRSQIFDRRPQQNSKHWLEPERSSVRGWPRENWALIYTNRLTREGRERN